MSGVDCAAEYEVPPATSPTASSRTAALTRTSLRKMGGGHGILAVIMLGALHRCVSCVGKASQSDSEEIITWINMIGQDYSANILNILRILVNGNTTNRDRQDRCRIVVAVICGFLRNHAHGPGA